ncbi:hypothetical protein C8J57DRAFT_507041, partial [Mycena rebaudengoi]
RPGFHTLASQIPWGQLINLTLITRITFQELLYVFQHCLLLQQCSLGDLDLPENDEEVPEVTFVSWRNLISLSLAWRDESSPIALALSTLILPALCELEVRIISSAWPHAPFMSLLSRSQCPLTALFLREVDITFEDFADCLRGVTKTLKRLEIVHSPLAAHPFISDRQLSLLTYSTSREYLCPKLTNLKLHRCLDSSDGTLAEMIESRWNVPATTDLTPLKTVDIICMHGHEEDRARLQQFQLEGLDIKLEIYP